MKRLYIESLQVDDSQILERMCEDRQLSSYPLLRENRELVQREFRRYVENEGHGLGQAPDVPVALGAALQRHYTNEISALRFISRIRAELSPDICPCCGSGSSSSVDHVLPQGIWKLYSIFSWNLVPACEECNRKKGSTYAGETPQERPVHPYFDDFLTQRLVRAELRPPYDTPEVRIVVMPRLEEGVRGTVEWHLAHVVRRTSVTAVLNRRWLNACRRPAVAYPTLRRGAIIAEAVADKLAQMDQEYGTPNNWESMLQAGIASDLHALGHLQACIDDPLLAARH